MTTKTLPSTRANDFGRVGWWSAPGLKLQHDVRIPALPGFYAYVVEGRLRYIGKAARLRSRTRSYNRALRPPTSREFRNVHRGIAKAWREEKTVEVYVCARPDLSAKEIHMLEPRWIAERAPEWNGPPITHH